MPRYIDAELLDPEDFENCTPYQAREIIEDIPTADVVPKSAYDSLEKFFNDMTQEAQGYLNRLYGIRAEVARDIIDKIESVMFDRFSNIMLGEDIRLCLAELKKKYTEVSTDEM